MGTAESIDAAHHKFSATVMLWRGYPQGSDALCCEEEPSRKTTKMPHPDLDLSPPKLPFDRYWVLGYRIECGTEAEEWFFVFEVDLVNDNLGPRGMPPQRTESDVRVRLTELGLNEPEIEARIAWARRWMATRIVKSKDSSVLWLPPL
jgi:hypothetical protein